MEDYLTDLSNHVENLLDTAQSDIERDGIVKSLILNENFKTAYFIVCKYITKRSVMDLHKSIILNISGNKSTLDLAPRGFGKSTVGDVDYCITRILRDPNIRIMIGSKTQTQAEAFLKEVRTHFEQNEDLIRIFGDWKTSKDNVWNDREFTVNKRTITMADVNTNTATQTQEQGNGTQTNTTANANTTGAGADNTPKVKTEEEIRAELQKEYEKMADKRVTDAIKKKEKEWADKQAKEKMTEDERRQAEEQERLQAQAKRDLDLTIKGLKLDVVDAVQEMGLDAGFRNLIAVEDLATITDEDERKAKLTERVKGMKKLFDAEVAKEVAKAKAEFLKGSTPATGSSSNKKDETKYDAYKKAGNVKGMLSEKLGAYRNKEDEE